MERLVSDVGPDIFARVWQGSGGWVRRVQGRLRRRGYGFFAGRDVRAYARQLRADGVGLVPAMRPAAKILPGDLVKVAAWRALRVLFGMSSVLPFVDGSSSAFDSALLEAARRVRSGD